MAIKKTICTVCSEAFNGSSNAMYCSNKCKQSAYRAKNATSGFIYKLMKGGEVVYVGQSKTEKGVMVRLADHIQGERVKDFDTHESFKVEGASLNEVEAAEIIKHKPVYNKILPSNDSYITAKQLSSQFVSSFEDLALRLCNIHKIGDETSGIKNYMSKEDAELFCAQVKDLLEGCVVVNGTLYSPRR